MSLFIRFVRACPSFMLVNIEVKCRTNISIKDKNHDILAKTQFLLPLINHGAIMVSKYILRCSWRRIMAHQHEINNKLQGLPNDVLVDVVTTFKALSDPTRTQLVYLLTKREYSVNELSEHVTVSPSAVSHHLSKLRSIHLVRTRREGNQVFYSIDDSHVANMFREALFHLDHIRKNLPDHPYPEYLSNLNPE